MLGHEHSFYIPKICLQTYMLNDNVLGQLKRSLNGFTLPRRFMLFTDQP